MTDGFDAVARGAAGHGRRARTARPAVGPDQRVPVLHAHAERTRQGGPHLPGRAVRVAPAVDGDRRDPRRDRPALLGLDPVARVQAREGAGRAGTARAREDERAPAPAPRRGSGAGVDRGRARELPVRPRRARARVRARGLATPRARGAARPLRAPPDSPDSTAGEAAAVEWVPRRVPTGGSDGGDRAGGRLQGVRGRDHGRLRPHARHPGPGVHRAGRSFRVREDDRAPDGGRAGEHHPRDDRDRRSGREHRAAEGAGHRDGVPELRAVPAHERVRQHGVRSQAPQAPEGGDRPPGPSGRGDPGPRGVPRAQAQGAVRRTASARGDGASDRSRTPGVPDGRAAVQPRREAARADAGRGLTAAGRSRRHDDLRHARSGRGDDDGRSRRRPQEG